MLCLPRLWTGHRDLGEHLCLTRVDGIWKLERAVLIARVGGARHDVGAHVDVCEDDFASAAGEEHVALHRVSIARVEDEREAVVDSEVCGLVADGDVLIVDDRDEPFGGIGGFPQGTGDLTDQSVGKDLELYPTPAARGATPAFCKFGPQNAIRGSRGRFSELARPRKSSEDGADGRDAVVPQTP